MTTDKRSLGDWGERKVASLCDCPRCKRLGTTRLLPTNFKCADLICDFCGFLSQVKTSKVKDTKVLPNSLLGGAWNPQSERMNAGIYFPLYVVLVTPDLNTFSIFFLSADLQSPSMFQARKPLSANARRAGWQGFRIDCNVVRDRFVKIV